MDDLEYLIYSYFKRDSLVS